MRFDGDDVVLDLELVDNAVAMPYTLLDANTMPFEVAGDGSVLSGKNFVFQGTGSPADSRGMRLEVVVGGVPVPFLNGDGTIGRLAQAGRELQLDEDNLASRLKVTRKIFVPRDGYFARYLETLENTTDAPITVGLRVVTNHRGLVSNPRVVDSSDGDQILSVLSAENRDRWVIVDDLQDADPFTSGGTPATGHVFDGGGAVLQVASAGYELVGTTASSPGSGTRSPSSPGKTVALMHFVFNQLDRFRARQAALRLSQMPPEALEGLTSDERESIVNFQVPAEGASPVEPLPTVSAGVIQGKVLSGDGVTPIPSATVHFKSRSVLYGRSFSVTAGPDGAFELRARTDGSSERAPDPALHLRPRRAASQDVGLHLEHRRRLRPAGDGGHPEPHLQRHRQPARHRPPPLGRARRRRSRQAVHRGLRLLLGAQLRHHPGQRQLPALGQPPRRLLRVRAEVAPPGAPGGGEPLRGRATTTLTAGDTAVADIVLESTGTLSGVVRTAGGDPVEDAPVNLYFANGTGGFLLARAARTDTGGLLPLL